MVWYGMALFSLTIFNYCLQDLVEMVKAKKAAQTKGKAAWERITPPTSTANDTSLIRKIAAIAFNSS